MTIKALNADALNHTKTLSSKLNVHIEQLKTYLGIHLFEYLKVFHDGKFIYGSSDFQLAQSLIKYCEENKGTILSESLLGNKHNMHAITFPRTPNHPIMHCIKESGYWNGLHILNLQKGYTEIFVFASEIHNTRINNFYVRHHKIFMKIAKYFVNENISILQDTPTNGLAFAKDDLLFLISQTQHIIKEESVKVKKYFNSTRELSFNLSFQEYCCIEILSQGKTMKETARILNLSPRTVESYVENVKAKTGCNFKSQILDLFLNDQLNTKTIL